MGETTTVAVFGGFAPELAVQANGPEPELANDAFCPEQIVVEDGVTLIGAVDVTVTVVTDELVHVPAV